MIRFIEIKGQIIEDERVFAYFNTVTDEFFGWSNSYVWSTWNDFVEDYNIHKDEVDQIVFPLQRFREITPHHITNKPASGHALQNNIALQEGKV